MLRKLLLIVTILLVSCSICQLDAQAQRGRQKFRHTDRNRDGVIDKKEVQMEKRWEHQHRSEVNTWWESRADADKDGKVDADELSDWKDLQKTRVDLDGDGEISAKERRLCWRHARSRVNTSLESEYDDDGDGWLEPEEAKEFLNARYALIRTHGRAKVNSPLEEEYDTNNDGIISVEEAEALKEDLN